MLTASTYSKGDYYYYEIIYPAQFEISAIKIELTDFAIFFSLNQSTYLGKYPPPAMNNSGVNSLAIFSMFS